MEILQRLARVACLATWLFAFPASAEPDLPNENLPGNSPTLPNSNLPGSLPTDNPIYLPDTDTSRAVVQPGDNRSWLFPLGANVPERNPTLPLQPEEIERAQPGCPGEELETLRRDAATARQEAAAGREEASAARRDAATATEAAAVAREEAVAARTEAAVAREEAAAALQQAAKVP